MKEIRYLLSYAWKKSKLLFLTTPFKYIFNGVIPLIGVVGLGIVVDSIESGQPYKEVIRSVVVYLSVNLGVSLLKIMITFFDSIVMRKASDKTQLDYMSDCININYHYAEDRSVLELKKKSMGANPVWFLDDFFALFLYIVQFIGITYLFAELSPWFIVIVLITSSVGIALNFKSKKIGYDYSMEQSEDGRKLEYLYRAMTDYRFAKDIRINGAGGLIGNKYKGVLKYYFKKTEKNERRGMKIRITSVIITILQTVIMYGYFSWQVFSGAISVADYTVLLGATALLTSILMGFFGSIATIKNTLKYTSLFREYKEMIARHSVISQAHTCDKAVDWGNPEITFSHVCFSYPNTDTEVLRDINFTIHANENVGLVGLNGSGKTTIIKLLLRLYDPTSGAVLINGIDIREIPHTEYIKHIGIILQDFYVFAFSVRENIAFDRPFDETLCVSSLQKAGVYDRVANLQRGINTAMYKYCDENGVELSGGENQKLCIARSIYKKPDLMVMDEPSSTLDPLAEYQLFHDLIGLSDQKATLFISHRLSSTVSCDRIIVLSEGRIAEIGNHDELIKNKGLYSELFQIQASYYEKEVQNEA